MTISEEKEFRIKEEGKKLILKVTETGGRDFMNDGTEYYMILKPLKDEDEVKEEIVEEVFFEESSISVPHIFFLEIHDIQGME
jgi:hypothetical protein